MQRPKVSVAVVTYNQKPYIGQALDSILSQSVDFLIEVVVGDDGSSDGTREILLGYQQSDPQRMKIIFHEKNIGGKENYISVLKACTGEYVATLDGDDRMLPGKLQKQADFLDAHPECAIVCHDVRIFDTATGNTIGYFNEKYKKPVSTIEDLVWERIFFAQCSNMYRNYDGPTDADIADFRKLNWLGDWLCHIQHARFGHIGYIDEVLSEWRRGENNFYSAPGGPEKTRGRFADHSYCLDCAEKYGVNPVVVDRARRKLKYEFARYWYYQKEFGEFKKYILLASDGKDFFDKEHPLFYRFYQVPRLLPVLFSLRYKIEKISDYFKRKQPGKSAA